LYLVGVGVLVFVLPRWLPVDQVILSAFTLGILFLQAPLETALSWAPALGRAEVALAAVEGLALAPAGSASARATAGWDTLAARGIVYRHAETGFVIGPIDLELRRGEVVFLVGGNGSGKTTLAKVLVGLYPLAGGALLADGEAVVDLDAHRETFGAIFADSFVFDHVEPGDTTTPLRTLGLADVVRVEAGRLSTTALSTGQRRRLLLLQAWMEDRPALVLDEWAADQDPGFRELFYRTFLPAMKARGTCVLVISHDDRYFGAADRIVRMEEGKIPADDARSSA
jgi:putative ATP-binding cassette transporter